MKLKTHLRTAGLLAALAGMAVGQCCAVEAGTLRAGAAKVDITPADPSGLTNLWGNKFIGVHDKIYGRAIVLDNGETSAAIVAVDTVEITDGAPIVARISRETNIPAANIILAATHDHNAPMVSMQNADGSRKAGPAGAAFFAQVEDDLVSVVKQAKGNMQPARLGVAKGAADVNVNRDEKTPNGYIFGRNPPGISDKTVWVLKLETTTGQPIALLINYAVHATIIGVKNTLLTGELSGATSRFVEQQYNDKVVALWTSSAAGDQHPIIMSDEGGPANFEAVDVLGRILGEEVVRVADGMKASLSQPRIWGAQKIVTCPGQKVIGGGMGDPIGDVKAVDAAPVSFRLGVLMIDKIALTEVSAEVVTKIYMDLRKESPYANTIMITLANGRVGYIPDDASYDIWTQEAVGSPLKKGCGESTIVNGLVDLMRQY